MAYKPTILSLAEGGTNASLTASNGGILYSTASAAAVLSGTSTANQVLLSGSSTTPSWSTATYPATAGTSGNVLTSDGTNWTSSNARSQLITISGQLTSAQIKALHATPIAVVAAPGATNFIFPISVSLSFVYGGSNVFVAGAAQTVAWYYGTTIFASGLSNAQIVGTTNTITGTNTITPGGAATLYLNQPVNLYNSVATEISGNAANDNVINYSITYRIVAQ